MEPGRLAAGPTFQPVYPPEACPSQKETEQEAQDEKLGPVLFIQLGEALAGEVARDQGETDAESAKDFVSVHEVCEGLGG